MMGDHFLAYFQEGAEVWWCFEHSSVFKLFRGELSGFLGRRGRGLDLFCSNHFSEDGRIGWASLLSTSNCIWRESIRGVSGIQVLFISSEDYGSGVD